MPKGIYLHKKGYKRLPFSKETRRKISKALKGKHHSEETKRKLSKINKGKIPKNIKMIAGWSRGMKTGFLSKNPEETRKRMSEAQKKLKHHKGRFKKGQKGINTIRGENHYHWKGGITPENKRIRRSIEFRLWRESVFARDNYTCQKCKEKGGKLHPHHIQNFAQYPELRFAIDNGITLCRECHKLFHKKFGLRNNTKEQLEEFLKNS